MKIECNLARLGFTDHAQSALGDVVFVELPAVGSEVKAGDILGTVESVKAVSDIFAPLSGKVVEVNEGLESAPETVNGSPHEEGWLAVLEMSDLAEAEGLLDAAGYEALLSEG